MAETCSIRIALGAAEKRLEIALTQLRLAELTAFEIHASRVAQMISVGRQILVEVAQQLTYIVGEPCCIRTQAEQSEPKG